MPGAQHATQDAAPVEPPAERRPDWRHALMRVAKPTIRLLLVAAVIEYILLPQIAGSRKNLHTLSNVNLYWAGLGVLCEVAAILAYGVLTKVTMRDEPVGFGRLMQIDLTTMAVSHVVPAGSAVGVGLGYRLLTRFGVSKAGAASAKTVQTVGSAVVLNLILAIALIAAIFLHGNNPLYAPFAGAGVVLLLAVGTAAFLVTRGQQRVADVMTKLLGWLPRVDPEAGRRLVNSLAETLHALAGDRKFLSRTTFWAAANWMLDAASLWCFVHAFGHTLGPVGLLVAYGLANVAAALPITPGGLGVVEGVLVPTLVAFSTTRDVAVLGVLGWRLMNFWLPIPLGFACYARLSMLSPGDDSEDDHDFAPGRPQDRAGDAPEPPASAGERSINAAEAGAELTGDGQGRS
jgi:uncharacterized protein (TIRG00374 family)